MSDEFVPCNPCIDPRYEKHGIPPPHWWYFLADEKFSHSCKDAWGFGSCPSSPANKRRENMSEREKIKQGASLFPLMDVAQYFVTVFGEPNQNGGEES